jgi:tRNA dimethylallyltransferase
VDPRERWNAARWAEAATVAIEEARAAGRVAVVVGGTGLYLRALFEPLFAEPALDPDARAQLAAQLDPLPTEALRARVTVLDPPRAHLGRTQLLRALEVAELTGRPISWWHEAAPRSPSFAPCYLVVEAADGPSRIERRVDAMLRAGWLEEVHRLAEEVVEHAPAWNATGYAELRAVVAGRQSVAEARTAVIVATRQYAKRQRTWCRHQLPADVIRVDPNQPGAPAVIGAWWHASFA